MKINNNDKRSRIKALNIGDGVTVGPFVEITSGAQLGSNIVIGSHCFLGDNVILGDNVTLGSGISIQLPTHIGPGASIGQNVTFASHFNAGTTIEKSNSNPTEIAKNAKIGGAAVIFSGITVGIGAVVEPGAIVTQSVPPYAIVAGHPAKITSYVENQSLETERPRPTQKANVSSNEHITNLNIGGATLHNIKLVADMRGDLSAGEFLKDIPFNVKRYFLVFNVPSEKTRGEHAHHECHQFLICVKGSCAVVVDDGIKRSEVQLDSPSSGLYIPPKVWGIQYKYSPDAVLLVFASHYYDADDYIRDYDDFLSLSNQE